MTTTFDSLAFKDTLVEGGFSDRQAAVLAHAIWDLVTNRLATKEDLLALEQRFEAKFDLRLAQLKVELLMWIISLTVVQTTILGAMLKLLH
ncbi:MAG TPA: DUF1640 domain-containing protein [Burkholderiaceae bacterium]|nr:DUF1640 domain-containing protein [Burkholderiaceae bacterium]